MLLLLIHNCQLNTCTHTHERKGLRNWGPCDPTQRHIQYNRVQQTMVTDIQKIIDVLIYFQRSGHLFLMYIEAFFKNCCLCLSHHQQPSCEWQMLPQTSPSSSSLSKIPSIWALSLLPLPFLLLLFYLQSSGRNLGHFQFVSLCFLSV